jgi:hypothetical protein
VGDVISDKTKVIMPFGLYIKVFITVISLILGCKAWYENDQEIRSRKVMAEVNTKLDIELYKRDQELTDEKIEVIGKTYSSLDRKIDAGFRDIKGDMKFMLEHLTNKN